MYIFMLIIQILLEWFFYFLKHLLPNYGIHFLINIISAYHNLYHEYNIRFSN